MQHDPVLKFLVVGVALVCACLAWLAYRDAKADITCARAGYQHKIEISGQYYCVEKSVWVGSLR